MDIEKLKDAVDKMNAHDLTEHYAMRAEYTALVQERKAGVTPVRAEQIRLRLNKLRALGRVSSAKYRAKCDEVRKETKALIDATQETDPVELSKLRDSIVISLREGKSKLDRDAWKRKGPKP